MKFSKNIIWGLLQASDQKFSLVKLMEISGLSRRAIISALKELVWEGKVAVSEVDRPHSPGKKLNVYSIRSEEKEETL